jgi:hypothetical protein
MALRACFNFTRVRYGRNIGATTAEAKMRRAETIAQGGGVRFPPATDKDGSMSIT